MSSRRAKLVPLLVAITLVVGIQRTAVAQNPGDPATVQFGSYLSPTAESGHVPFLLSYNCYSWTTPPRQGCDVENYGYSAALFASFLGPNQAIQITSFTFFSALQSASQISIVPNIYDVYMGVAGGSLSFFGTFGGGNPICGTLCALSCDHAPSLTCMPEGSGGVGSYVYDPNRGDLQVVMMEKFDHAVGYGCCYWYDNDALVTRFDGNVVATPEPATIVLVGSGFTAVMGFARRRRRDTSHGRLRDDAT